MTTHVRLCLTDHRNPQLDRSLLDWCGKQHCVSRESKRVWHHAQRGLLFYIESWFPMEPPNLLSEFKTRYVSCGSPSVDYVERSQLTSQLFWTNIEVIAVDSIFSRQNGNSRRVCCQNLGQTQETSSLRIMGYSTVKVWTGPWRTSPSTSRTERRSAKTRLVSK